MDIEHSPAISSLSPSLPPLPSQLTHALLQRWSSSRAWSCE